LNNQIELRTERLLLRPFRMSDVDDWLDITCDKEWARYQINIPPVPLSRKQAEELTAMFSDTAAWEKIGMLQMFAIVLDGKVIGEIAVNQRDDDRPNERVEISYSLARKYWNKGLMTEAAMAVMNRAFQIYSFNRMYAWCDPRNTGSWRVMEKLGMRREGLLRSHIKWNGEFRDQLFYGILREEWKG
jgi:[ribosomal protein S5]-alanine N-acetyltransferase